MKRQSRLSLDLMGICISFVCMLHCLAIPLLLILGIESILWAIDQEWLEWAIILSSLAIGSFAFYKGYLRHRQHFIPVLFVAGFLLLINGESVSQEWAGLGLSVIGAGIMAYAHMHNLRWQHGATPSN